MSLSTLGEFGLIDRIKKRLKSKYIGDDCAFIPPNMLLTTDTMVEDVHFSFKTFNWFKLGWKIIAVNISDIAAMGGIPKYALVTLGLNNKASVNDIDDLYTGMQKISKKYKLNIVGGDIVRSKQIFVTVVLIGHVEKNLVVKRSGAKVGDLIMTTGTLGKAAKSKYTILPQPRIKEGRLLAKNKIATAMIDNSDGLIRSIAEICKASGVGARINSCHVPVASGATIEDALFGGEDYELVFTGKNKFGTIVGEIVSKSKGITLDGKPVKKFGWEHF